MTKVGVLLGGDEQNVKNQMKKVLEFETELAKVLITCLKRRLFTTVYSMLKFDFRLQYQLIKEEMTKEHIIE